MSVFCVLGSEGSRTLSPSGLWAPSSVALLPSTSFLIPGLGWSHGVGTRLAWHSQVWPGYPNSPLCHGHSTPIKDSHLKDQAHLKLPRLG